MSEEITKDQRPKTKDLLWLLNCSLITAIAAFLRFFWLELKPLHHDEGVNGYFLTTLFRDGVYKYDPANYHGPDLYYISLAFSKVFGLNTLSVRSSVAIFGVLTVFLAFFLKKHIGKTGSLAAAMFLALSPGMVYISRYFIHEILFVFFSFAIVIALLYFIEGRKAGVFAIASMSLILLICFSPSVINLSAMFNLENTTAVWMLRIGFFLIEAVLVFFVMRMLLAWNDGRPIYLLLASASLVLLFATKETGFITIGTMAIACFCIYLWRKLNAAQDFANKKNWMFLAGTILSLFALIIERKKIYESFSDFPEKFLEQTDTNLPYIFYGIIALAAVAFITWIYLLFTKDTETEPLEKVELTWANFRAKLGASTDLILILAASAAIFIYLGVLFFSSFFTYPEGVKGAFEAYAIWTKTGSKDHTQNGRLAYVKWMLHVETPIVILSVIGTAIAVLKARHRFAMFAGLWAFGLFLAYTIIPYKTPWLALSFLLPMCIIAGYAINELLRSTDLRQKIAGAVLGIAATCILAYQTYDLNFVRYDDNDMPYIYAHTTRGFLDLIAKIEYYADKSDAKKDATIEIVSPDYWSMPWYLNDYKNARFSGSLVDANTAEMIVAKKDEQDAEVMIRYAAHYKYVGEYPLRPGVDLILLVRKDLADSDAQELYKIYGSPVLVTP
jgi:uncharacterized protein (TIGR03663 family)